MQFLGCTLSRLRLGVPCSSGLCQEPPRKLVLARVQLVELAFFEASVVSRKGTKPKKEGALDCRLENIALKLVLYFCFPELSHHVPHIPSCGHVSGEAAPRVAHFRLRQSRQNPLS